MTLADSWKGHLKRKTCIRIYTHLNPFNFFKRQCAEEASVEQLTDSVYLPSIMKVLGLTSWQGVVTVIMLSGSFPCNHNDTVFYAST